MQMTIINRRKSVYTIDLSLSNGEQIRETIEPQGSITIPNINPFDINTTRIRSDDNVEVLFDFELEDDIPSIFTLYGVDIFVGDDPVFARTVRFVGPLTSLEDDGETVTVDVTDVAGYVRVEDYRQYIPLIGPMDGANLTFQLPEPALHLPGGLQLKIYRNGVLLRPGAAFDYTVSESGGSGTGFDTVTFVEFPPKARDSVWADYIVA